jgi:hypothetical protein
MGTKGRARVPRLSPCENEKYFHAGLSEMELAGLEPATSWVRCRAAIRGESPRFRL